jgi:hypothetical protein
MTTNPWPPEGTRVRIIGTMEDGNTGRIHFEPTLPRIRYVVLDLDSMWVPVYRHEIEVIDDER